MTPYPNCCTCDRPRPPLEFATLWKYSSEGELLWYQDTVGPVVSICTDNEDNVYALVDRAWTPDSTPLLVKYDPYGEEVWQYNPNWQEHYYGRAREIIFDGNNLFMTTETSRVRMDVHGVQAWRVSMEGNPQAIRSRDGTLAILSLQPFGMVQRLSLLDYDTGAQIGVRSRASTLWTGLEIREGGGSVILSGKHIAREPALYHAKTLSGIAEIGVEHVDIKSIEDWFHYNWHYGNEGGGWTHYRVEGLFLRDGRLAFSGRREHEKHYGMGTVAEDFSINWEGEWDTSGGWWNYVWRGMRDRTIDGEGNLIGVFLREAEYYHTVLKVSPEGDVILAFSPYTHPDFMSPILGRSAVDTMLNSCAVDSQNNILVGGPRARRRPESYVGQCFPKPTAPEVICVTISGNPSGFDGIYNLYPYHSDEQYCIWRSSDRRVKFTHRMIETESGWKVNEGILSCQNSSVEEGIGANRYRYYAQGLSPENKLDDIDTGFTLDPEWPNTGTAHLITGPCS